MSKINIEEIIHSLYQNQDLVTKDRDFSGAIGDLWVESWIKEERIYRLNDPDGVRIPIYGEADLENVGDISGKDSDTLAFYISYHYSRQQWGIYLLRSGVNRLTKYLQTRGLGFFEAIQVSRDFLIRHELTHFQSDFGITTLELAIKTPIFLKFRQKIRLDSPGWSLVEEGLANRLARSEAGPRRRELNDFLNAGPIGYSDWNLHKSKDESYCWSQVLQLGPILGVPSDTRLLGLNSMIVAKKYFEDVPVYEVIDIPMSKPADYFLGPITNIRETDEFRNDLQKLSKGQPRYRIKWQKTKEKLNNGNLIGGTHLEKLKGTRIPIYSVGLDSEARVALRKDAAWEAIAADHHDPLYDRMARKYGA